MNRENQADLISSHHISLLSPGTKASESESFSGDNIQAIVKSSPMWA